jgi:hypothetical protein
MGSNFSLLVDKIYGMDPAERETQLLRQLRDPYVSPPKIAALELISVRLSPGLRPKPKIFSCPLERERKARAPQRSNGYLINRQLTLGTSTLQDFGRLDLGINHPTPKKST